MRRQVEGAPDRIPRGGLRVSPQSDKVINSGEGGFITSDDPEMMAKAIYLSGAYGAR